MNDPRKSSDQPDGRVESREEQFVRLLNAAHLRLRAYLLSLLGNRHDADDVLQQASVLMWQKFDTFEPGTDFVAWASKVALYEARNFQRVSARSRLQFSEALLETLAAERLEDAQHLDQRLDALDVCIEQLDERSRQLLQGVYMENSDVAALATQLGRAKQTLYNRLAHIRRALAECIERRLAEGLS
jgi:RNA polymerase sigma-70 factor (ECF subfamily)